VTCSLPAVLLLVCWWKKGRVQRGDVMPLLPFFVVGVALGLLTAWMEKHHVGARGADWSLTFADRCLIAGRALWFYAGKLVWPAPLTFIYPRWEIEPAVWWQWLFPIAAAGVVAGLWLARRRIGKGPLVAVLFFAGTLGPALGFVNVYPMRYSFVADHFQYLASVGLIILFAAGLNRAPRVIPATLVVLLGALTWQQTGIYRDLETLWRDTLAKNPGCWMAQNNLGTVFADKGRYDEAIKYYRKAIQLNPNFSEAQYGLGLAFAAQGRLDEAIENYRKAIQINPDYRDALNDLGNALASKGRFDEAIGNYRKAIRINPNYAEARYNLGNALAAQGQLDEAIENYYKAIRINPNYAEAQNNLGIALADKGRFGEAIEAFRKAIQSKPDFSEALNNLGGVLLNQGRFDEAIENYRKAIQSKPNFSEALNNLGTTLAAQGRYDEAIENYRKAIQSKPDFSEALNNLAWVLATCPDAGLRNGAEAVRLAERACELTHYGEPSFIGTLAAAYAEAGRFPEAVTTAEKAVQLATDAGSKKTAGENRQRLELYRTGKPYHEPAPTVR
jgi:tetratricopeptide (TPR) repeat protein